MEQLKTEKLDYTLIKALGVYYTHVVGEPYFWKVYNAEFKVYRRQRGR
jgi:hypothetical protein